MNPEIRKIAKWARENGWDVHDDTKGYTHFRYPDGTHVYAYPATPRIPIGE